MKRETGKPGRPKKPEGEKLEQFSIRLPAKLKFGLEAMSRLQGRSLSQSMEWALETAVTHVKVRQDGDLVTTLGDAIETAWPLTGWERIFKLYQSKPGLVSFEDRHACELVEMSAEYRELTNIENEQEKGEMWGRWSSLVDSIWPQLVADSTKMRLAPKLHAGLPLRQVTADIAAKSVPVRFEEVPELQHLAGPAPADESAPGM